MVGIWGIGILPVELLGGATVNIRINDEKRKGLIEINANKLY